MKFAILLVHKNFPVHLNVIESIMEFKIQFLAL